jgi:hypothetical protein
MHIVLKDRIVPIIPSTLEKLESLYEDYEKNRQERTQHAITELNAFMGRLQEAQSAKGPTAGNDAENAKPDECATTAASEAAQRNENENEQQPPET